MAFTRKFLRSLGIEDDKVDTIMDAHVEVTNGLIAERDAARNSAPDTEALKTKIADLEKQLGEAKKAGAAEVQAAFDAFKSRSKLRRTMRKSPSWLLLF